MSIQHAAWRQMLSEKKRSVPAGPSAFATAGPSWAGSRAEALLPQVFSPARTAWSRLRRVFALMTASLAVRSLPNLPHVYLVRAVSTAFASILSAAQAHSLPLEAGPSDPAAVARISSQQHCLGGSHCRARLRCLGAILTSTRQDKACIVDLPALVWGTGPGRRSAVCSGCQQRAQETGR